MIRADLFHNFRQHWYPPAGKVEGLLEEVRTKKRETLTLDASKDGYLDRFLHAGFQNRRAGCWKRDYDTSEHVDATSVKAAGVPSDFVQMVPSRVIGRDRT